MGLSEPVSDMKFIVTYFFVLACATLQATAVSNAPLDQLSLLTRYAGMGYNALQANPEGDFYLGGVNPGIKTTRFIFNHTYCLRRQAFFDGQSMQVPDQVSFHLSHSCSWNNATNAYSGQTSYRDKLTLNVDASGSYDGLISAEFSLSTAMSQAHERTQNRQSIVVQTNKICNYGQARYHLASALSGASGYSLHEDFKHAVRLLPSTYSASEYMQFLDDWGTHVIETATLGTRDISRKSVSYVQAYEILSQESSTAASAGATYLAVSGNLSVDVSRLSEAVNENTQIGDSFTAFMIGTAAVPSPIHTKVAMLNETLVDNLWAENERVSIRQKKIHLERALRDYAANKGASILADPSTSFPIPWPQGQYSLIQASSYCPPDMSSGWRYQDNEDHDAWPRLIMNHWKPSDIDSCIRFDKGRDFKTYYCTKTVNDGVVSWPRGKYCVGRYGGTCPRGFILTGYKYWNDDDQHNVNSKMDPVPDGTYDEDTKVYYCCRSDGNHNDEILLPTSHAFVLYRYDGSCQRVRGMNSPIELLIQFDDENSYIGSNCDGNHPDGDCRPDQDVYLCYYSPINTQNHCASSYYKRGTLSVYVRNAWNLYDTDPLWNNPDPYVRVQAYTDDGVLTQDGVLTRDTHYISGNRWPSWETNIEFGCRNYESFLMLQLWDSNDNADDPMSTKEKITITPGHPHYIRHYGYGDGVMQYDYHFIIDGNECVTNHCQHGGTCVDGCASYLCNCPSSYTGFHCEH